MANAKLFLHQNPTMRKKLKANPELWNDPTTQLPIHISYSVSPGRFRMSTGISIAPIQWDEKRQLVNRKHKRYSDINHNLEYLIGQIDKAYWELKRNDQQPTPQLLKQILKPEKAPEPDKTFWAYYDIYIKEETPNLAETSVKKITSIRNIMKSFEEHREKAISFNSIDMELYNSLIAYLSTVKGERNNTIGKNIKALKRFLNFALDRGWHTNTTHQNRSFAAPRDKIDVIRLTKDQVNKLYTAQIDKPNLRQARDMFVFGCLTGLRIGDIQNLQPQNIQGDEIVLTTGKNKKQVRIPIASATRQIIDRYTGTPFLIFPKISQQKARVNLKKAIAEVSEETELDKEIVVVHYSLKKRIETKTRLADFIAFHHAKRTAVSLMLQGGMPVDTVLQITGNSRDTIEAYVKIESDHTKQEYIKSMNNAIELVK